MSKSYKAGRCVAPVIKKKYNLKLLCLLFRLKDIKDTSFQISRKCNYPDEVTVWNTSKNSVLSHASSKRSLTMKRLFSTAVQHQSKMDLVGHVLAASYSDVIKETMKHSITLTFLITFYWNKKKNVWRQVFVKKIAKSILAKQLFIKRETHLKKSIKNHNCS